MLALIKSLIYARKEEGTLEARLNKIHQSRLKLTADSRLIKVRLKFQIKNLEKENV